MIYVFDLDGTLFDTRNAVLAAYRAVGVEPPENFFSLSWRQWLKDEKLHDAKNKEYLELIVRGFVLPLPAFKTYLNLLQKDMDVRIWTAASVQAVEALSNKYMLGRCIAEMTVQIKLSMMRQIASHEYGTIFDDSTEAIQLFKEVPRWTACHVVS